MQEEGVFYALELSSAGFVSPAVSPLDWGVWTPHLLVSLPRFCMHNGDKAFWTLQELPEISDKMPCRCQ